MAIDQAAVPEYRGVLNIGETTHIYGHANIYVGHGVIVPKKMAYGMVEDFPEQLELMDNGVIETRIKELTADVPEDATASDRERKFLHKVFATVEPEDDESGTVEPQPKSKAGKMSKAPATGSGL